MKKILLLFVGIFIFPILVSAENSVYFDKSEINVSPGETVDVNVIVSSNIEFTDVEFDIISNSTEVSLSNVSINEDFKNYSSSEYSLYSSTPHASGTVIATVTIKVDSSADIGSTSLIKIVDPKIISDKTYLLDTEELSVSVGEEEKSNLLKELSSELAPFEFSKDKFDYKVEVENDVEKFDLVASPEDENAIVVISNQKLNSNRNIITVTVTREGLDEKKYTVTVTKKEKKL